MPSGYLHSKLTPLPEPHFGVLLMIFFNNVHVGPWCCAEVPFAVPCGTIPCCSMRLLACLRLAPTFVPGAGARPSCGSPLCWRATQIYFAISCGAALAIHTIDILFLPSRGFQPGATVADGLWMGGKFCQSGGVRRLFTGQRWL